MLPGMELLTKLNPFTPYLFDKTVTTFGTLVENALQEGGWTGEGSNRRWVARYKLSDILTDGFQFADDRNDTSVFKAMDVYDEVG
jgi:hypothetical protein